MNLNSKLFRIGARDFAKGAVLTILAAVLTPILAVAQTGDFDALVNLDWAGIGKTSLTVFLAYLGKQFLTDNENRLLGSI